MSLEKEITPQNFWNCDLDEIEPPIESLSISPYYIGGKYRVVRVEVDK